ncbi:hypothetical protein PM082_012521 [Marasmius tenuissimus]|nr:hypothetical protein PM082_012521 [Marasmius tenuissimus]
MVRSPQIPNQYLSPRHLPDLFASTEDSFQIPNGNGDDDSYLSRKDGGGYSSFQGSNGEEYGVLGMGATRMVPRDASPAKSKRDVLVESPRGNSPTKTKTYSTPH